MIVVLKNGLTQAQSQDFIAYLEAQNVKTVPIVGSETTVLGLVGDTSHLDMELIASNESVERVMKVQEPYKLANRKFATQNTVIKVAPDVEIGGSEIIVMAGPCSVESEEQIEDCAGRIKASGAAILRGGAFKPRSSPYAFQGLKAEGLMLLKHAKKAHNIPIITEITNPHYLEMFMENVDIIQVGARNMQNFELLKELGRVHKPVLLKRGFSNTLEEWLMSAEYIMAGGNDQVILCERGIRTFETATRNTLDLSAIPALKRMTHLPVVVDPSHASGKAWMVDSLSKAAVACGADGLLIEVRPNPKCALCDGAQSLTPEQFDETMQGLRLVANAVGRTIR